MGHNIDAIIGKMPVNTEKIKEYKLAAAFEGEYAIIFLDRDALLYWYKKLGKQMYSKNSEIMNAELIHFLASEAGLETYGIIHTEYHAGMGEQRAALFNKGTLVKQGNINGILKELGVVVTNERDEFEQINLDEYRDVEYYYWNTDNWAEGKPNMIPGRTLDWRSLPE